MMYDPLSDLISKIRKVGFVNAHAHLDRAYTVTEEDFSLLNNLCSGTNL